jgi:hypothetical protein
LSHLDVLPPEPPATGIEGWIAPDWIFEPASRSVIEMATAASEPNPTPSRVEKPTTNVENPMPSRVDGDNP